MHAKTPMKHIIKEYLIQKIDAVPGCISSNRGRSTKLQTFVSALDSSGIKLFRQMEHNNFEKLLVNWSKLSSLMTQHGGHNVFGSWSDWGCPFDSRHLQQHWQDQAWRDLNIDESGPSDTNFQFRPTCATLTETVNLDDLTRNAALETDRRLPLLRSYLRHHASEEEQHGSMSSLKVEYYQAPTYGRLIARGPAGQKLT